MGTTEITIECIKHEKEEKVAIIIFISWSSAMTLKSEWSVWLIVIAGCMDRQLIKCQANVNISNKIFTMLWLKWKENFI